MTDENDICPYAHIEGTCMDREIARLRAELDRAREYLQLCWWEQSPPGGLDRLKAAMADEPREP